MKYINRGGNIPTRNSYESYTNAEFEELENTGDTGCSCGGSFEGSQHGGPASCYTHDDAVENGEVECRCFCHGG